MNEQIEKLAIDIGSQKERELKNAISHVIGNDKWSISDITGRAEMRRYPDNTEVFVFDGIELLVFYPIETSIDSNAIGVSLKATQKFRKLYAQQSVHPTRESRGAKR